MLAALAGWDERFVFFPLLINGKVQSHVRETLQSRIRVGAP
jgi:hypothetical protein